MVTSDRAGGRGEYCQRNGNEAEELAFAILDVAVILKTGMALTCGLSAHECGSVGNSLDRRI